MEKNDKQNLKEELGDVLMQVIFHAEVASENGDFNLEDVIEGICKKMIHRHPHVFGEATADTSDEVLSNWEEIKKAEKQITTQSEAMKQVPMALPALNRAKKVQKKAADIGFDFSEIREAMKKVNEEIEELLEAVEQNLGTEEEEYGDILFAFVNISRFLKINPEFALTKATKKFINRFEYVENTALLEGKKLSEMTLEEMDLLWDEAKKVNLAVSGKSLN
ncbi:MAG: nucleoside triphosphate pyrophosphohydrolase [Anaerotignum sp.]